jgi:hypothetical protein
MLDPVTAGTNKQNAPRQIQPIDLARLRDVGRGEDGLWEESPISVSPDGGRIAYQIRQADPGENRYCIGMFVAPLRGEGKPLQVDAGGVLLKGTMSIRGLAAFPQGTPRIVVPRWSPDGTMIAYIRSDGGPSRLWLAAADGSGSRAIGGVPGDILDLKWSEDGQSMFVATRPALDQAERQIDDEGLSGFHFDLRFSPAARSRPYVREPIAVIWSAIDLRSGTFRSVSPLEDRQAGDRSPEPQLASSHALASSGRRAWAEAIGAQFASPRVVKVSESGGDIRSCDDPDCRGVLTFGWAADGQSIWYVRRSGWASEEMSIHLWAPGQKPHLQYRVTGILSGCVRAVAEIICTEESSSSPMRIVGIDVETGHQRTIVDLNPEFQFIELAPVRRLRIKNSYGVESFADLVLPARRPPNSRFPLVVIQYQSRGFLRGGTGDEAPAFALAAQGLAVLSFNRPKDYYSDPAPTQEDYFRAVMHDRIDRRSVLSSLDALLDAAIDSGAIDPDKVGIWGLSDGASTTQHALLNGRHRFRAVSLASCCEDPETFELLGGPVLEEAFASYGYPSWGGKNDPWADYSLARNAARVRSPFLLQMADSEYMKSLEMASAFRSLGRPVDAFVFPNERHIKWQPAHRLAIYQRNIDWFRFWLLDKEDADPKKSEQYARWKAMREALGNK